MGRQRTVDDANFWRSPQIADCTQEDKATMLYLLTSPSSNIIGVYPVVPRVSAAEMGWMEEQFVLVLKRLAERALVGFAERTRYVWVKQWWEHNSPKMALGPKLRDRTIEQIAKIPDCWRADFIRDLRTRLPPELRGIIPSYLSTDQHLSDGPFGADTLSDRVSKMGSVNSNATYKSINNETEALPSARSDGASASSLSVSQIEMQKIRASFRGEGHQ